MNALFKLFYGELILIIVSVHGTGSYSGKIKIETMYAL